MLVNLEQATSAILLTFPDGDIQAVIEYQHMFIFKVLTGLEDETGYDPFFSVDRNTGEVRDFSIITDGNAEIQQMFVEAQQLGTEG